MNNTFEKQQILFLQYASLSTVSLKKLCIDLLFLTVNWYYNIFNIVYWKKIIKQNLA